MRGGGVIALLTAGKGLEHDEGGGGGHCTSNRGERLGMRKEILPKTQEQRTPHP